MTGWIIFAAVFGAFFVTHSVPVRPAVKARLQQTLGRTGFTLGYSVLSLGMLSALIWSAQNAPYTEIWPQADWQRAAVFYGMLTVCIIAALAIGRPNPFSFGGTRNDLFDPARPGIVRLTRHPLLVVLALWAGLHILPNGDLAHLLMFGVFGCFALLGRRIIDRRKQRQMGKERWHDLWARAQNAPLFQRPTSWPGLLLRLGAGVAAFALLLVLHPVLLGVSPLPF